MPDQNSPAEPSRRRFLRDSAVTAAAGSVA
ncbi:twin-arginine translocation signal domain-containing protein, partial [Herbaspirillum frisingense]